MDSNPEMKERAGRNGRRGSEGDAAFRGAFRDGAFREEFKN